MSLDDYGGPAFPSNDFVGLTVLDYFAAKIMQGMWADPGVELTAEEMVDKSFEIAALMVSRRTQIYNDNEKEQTNGK